MQTLQMSMEPFRDLSIAQQASKCLTLFESLLESQNEQESSENDIPHDALMDGQARLRTWIENDGVLQRGEASLDYRLRHADRRLTILDDLKQLWIALGENVPQPAKLLVVHEANTQKAEMYRRTVVRNVLRAQAQATSPKDSANHQSIVEDRIETKGLTPLHRAALRGDLEAIKAALKEGGADIEEPSQDGATPLMSAASKGHYYAIKRLLDSGANINAISTKGSTALMIAVRKQDTQTVKQLMSNGADINYSLPDGWKALHEAVYQGQRDIMKILLQGGACIDSRCAHDRTPLMQACHKGDEAAVRLLLGANSNMEATSALGETAISLAAGGGHTNIVQVLLMYGCAPEPPWAKKRHNGSKVISQKAKAKAEIETTREPKDKVHARGWTPLMLASQGGHVEIAQLLLERNVNTETRSPQGKTALEIARENGKKDMVLMLEFARDTMSWWQDQLDATPDT